ncbi:MAG: aminoacyl-tRNA hydrolase [Patescibacteria group bacterium]|jgi:PTH1 family peptidyl-tRNA hydrolase|nr:aminoacyl-tRNA hydrolase [Patescibacteria group bacterium]
MKLIAGLGNPGTKYENTWHNVGFLMIDELHKNYAGVEAEFKNSKKFKSLVYECNQVEDKIILAKPQTFMNNSGQAVSILAGFYKIAKNDLWVIHDDIDLPLGTIRISQNASAAGHRGVQSIIDQLNTQEFVRFRIGIRPTDLRQPTEEYVLQNINKQGKLEIEQAAKLLLGAIEISLSQGISEAMNEFN